MSSGDVQQVRFLRPHRKAFALNLRELWSHQELLLFFIWRDLKVRYKQTVIGALWAVLQPFFTMIVFSIFFGNLAKIPSDGVPYPIFSYCGLLPWTLFSRGIAQASNSLVANTQLISKVYFPRLLLPIAAVVTGVVDFAIAFLVLIGMMFYFGTPPAWQILWLPIFLLVALMTALGVGLWLAALNVRYRDIKYVLAFITSIWLYATPVIYPSSLLEGRLAFLLELNPMSGVVEGFRWALLGVGVAPGRMFLISALGSSLLLVSGVFYFARLERTFADVI